MSGAVGTEPPGTGGAAPLWCPTAAPQPCPASLGAVGSEPVSGSAAPTAPFPVGTLLAGVPRQAGRDGASAARGTRAVLHSPSPVLPVLGGPVPHVGRGPCCPTAWWLRGEGLAPPARVAPEHCGCRGAAPRQGPAVRLRATRSRSLRQVSRLSPAAVSGARHPAPVPARGVNKAGSQLPAVPRSHHVQPAAPALRRRPQHRHGARGHKGTGPSPAAPISHSLLPCSSPGRSRSEAAVARLRGPRALTACLGAWLRLWGCPSAAASWLWCSPRRGAELRSQHAAAGASVPGTARGTATRTGTSAACALWTRTQGARGGRGAGSTWLLPPAAAARRVLVSPLLIGPVHLPLSGMC